MTQHNSLNVRLSNSLLNKLKSVIKIESKVMLRLSLKVISNSDDEANLPYKLLLAITHVTDLHNAFENNLSIKIKLSKTQLSKIIQSGGFPCFLNRNRLVINGNCSSTISQKCFDTIRTNSCSISSRCRNK